MKKTLFGALSLLLFSGVYQAQTYDPNALSDGFKIYGAPVEGGTARYTSMGGAMGALGGDISATNVNPAGLGVYRSSSIAISGVINSLSNKAKMATSNKYSDTSFNFNNVGGILSIPIEGKWKYINIGFNYDYQSFDNDYVKFGSNPHVKYTESDGDTYQFYGLRNYLDGDKSNVNVNFGTNYDEKLFLGLGLNFSAVNFTKYNMYLDQNTTTNQITAFNQLDTPYSESANGFGFSLGAIYKLSQEIRLGAAYYTPTWWTDVKTDFIHHEPLYQNGELYGYQFDSYYYDGYKYNTPGKVVLSAAAVIGKNFSMDFDFINHFNSNMNFKSDDDSRAGENYFVDKYFKDSQEYKIGGEYRYNIFRFRAGYNYISSPTKKFQEGIVDQVSGNYSAPSNYLVGDTQKLSGGVGVEFNSFFVDFAYQNIKNEFYTPFYGTFVTPNITSGNGYYFVDMNDKMGNNYVGLGKVEKTLNNFYLTIGWKF